MFLNHINEIATGYSFRGKQADYWNVSAIEAAGSLRSTTSDMVKIPKGKSGFKQNKTFTCF